MKGGVYRMLTKEIKVSAAKVNDWGSVTGNFDVN